MNKIIPEIRTIEEKKLVGKKLSMNLTHYRVKELWKSFMPYKNEIENKTNEELISMVLYKKNHFKDFNPNREFEKWACVEVDNFKKIPSEMESYTLSSGLYAVFNYVGNSTDHSIFAYILKEWLPHSGYQLDERPHFEVLGSNYINNDSNSEEEIWIPIKMK
jgi:AraC family transcriptional regulator